LLDNNISKLLVHHHAVAYQDSKGIWINSVLGKWIIHLADHFEEVGLLVSVTENKKSVQDICITNENVILHSLGTPGKFWDKIQRTLRIRQVCFELENQYDFLLVRGITPRQNLIWEKIKVLKNKYFLLVGSLNSNLSIRDLRSLLDLFLWYIERYRLRELKRMLKGGSLLVNAHSLQEEAMAIFNKKAVFTPTNTISNKEFSNFEIRGINNPVRLLFCGRIEVKKGITEAIKAVNLLKKEGIEIQLDLVGPFEDYKFQKESESLIDKLNIDDQIIFHGRVPYGDELFSYFKKADIFILPSYTEGFPHVIWEAAGNCCPIIATKVGGIPSLFKHREHGILIPPRDQKVLADAISELISNTELRKNIVINAYKLALGYTVEKCAKQLSEIMLQDTTNNDK